MHKSWKIKIIDKQGQRKNGSKPFDTRGNQAQYSREQPCEYKMAENAGPRQPN